MPTAEEHRANQKKIVNWMALEAKAHASTADEKFPPKSIQQSQTHKLKKVYLTLGEPRAERAGLRAIAMRDWEEGDNIPGAEDVPKPPERVWQSPFNVPVEAPAHSLLVSAKAARFAEHVLLFPEQEVVVSAPAEFLLALTNAVFVTKDEALRAPFKARGEERIVMLHMARKTRCISQDDRGIFQFKKMDNIVDPAHPRPLEPVPYYLRFPWTDTTPTGDTPWQRQKPDLENWFPDFTSTKTEALGGE